MVDKKEVERLRSRFVLCRGCLARAKHDLVFWSRELGLVVAALKERDQLWFDFIEKEFVKDEVP